MTWFIVVAILAAGATAWARAAARAREKPWMRQARKLGFRPANNVSPPELVRTREGRRHAIRETFRPWNPGLETLDLSVELATQLPFRFFASLRAAESVPLGLAPLRVDGYLAAHSDDPSRAQPLLERMSNRLTRLARADGLELDERRALVRVALSASADELARALDIASQAADCLAWASAAVPPEQEAPLRWTGHWYEGQAVRGSQRVRLLLEMPSRGAEVQLATLGEMARRVDFALARLGALRAEIVARFAEEHAAWFEDAGVDRKSLTSELALVSLRLSEASTDALGSFGHRAFSGHLLEAVVSADGTLAAVTLQG